jgi:hypothetical protein
MIHPVYLYVSYMGDFLEPEELNYNCCKTMRRGAIDRYFNVIDSSCCGTFLSLAHICDTTTSRDP